MKTRLLVMVIALMVSACSTTKIFRRVEKNAQVFLKTYPNNFSTSEVNGRPLHYAFRKPISTTQVRLVFLHGAPGDWKGWAEYLMSDELSAHAEVIAVDRPGYGGSKKGGPLPSLKDQAEMISNLLSSTKDSVVVGHSLGGPLALQLALMYPDRIKGLVILAGSLDPELEERKWFQNFAEWWLTKWMVPDDLITCNIEINEHKKELESLGPLISSLKVRTLVIQGEKDELVPPANVDYLISKAPAQRLTVKRLSSEGHFIPWTQFELIKKEILGLLL